jgi:hypothetical protein
MSRIESAATIVCHQCGERFTRTGYANQHRGSRRRVKHSRYCSPGCRQRAYLQRLGASRPGVSKTALEATNSPASPVGRGCVTGPLELTELKGEIRAIFTKLDGDQGPPRGLLRDLRILGPADVIEAEVFGRYSWAPAVSSDGVAIEVAQLRPRVLAAQLGRTA